jgi:hypothetical protein
LTGGAALGLDQHGTARVCRAAPGKPIEYLYSFPPSGRAFWDASSDGVIAVAFKELQKSPARLETRDEFRVVAFDIKTPSKPLLDATIRQTNPIFLHLELSRRELMLYAFGAADGQTFEVGARHWAE